MDASRFFSGVEGARASNSSNYARPGHYFVRFDAMKIAENFQKLGFFVIEQTSLWTDPATVQAWESEGKPADKKPHAVGEEVVDVMKQSDTMFLPNIKAMVANLLEVTADQVTEEVCLRMVSPENPFGGALVECVNTRIFTRGKGQPFTKKHYKRIVPAAEIMAAMLTADPSGESINRIFKDGALERLVEEQGGV